MKERVQLLEGNNQILCTQEEIPFTSLKRREYTYFVVTIPDLAYGRVTSAVHKTFTPVTRRQHKFKRTLYIPTPAQRTQQ